MKLSRIGSLALVLLAGASACSSSTDNSVVTKKDGGSGGSKPSGDDTTGDDDDSTTTPVGDDDDDTNTKPTQDAGSVQGAEGGVKTSPEGGTGCDSEKSFTIATQISLDVTWKAKLPIDAGSGVVKLILITDFTDSGDGKKFSGNARTCRLLLPDVALNPTGSTAAGGNTVQINFPDSLWTQPSMPITKVAYTQSGFVKDSTISIAESTTLIGLSSLPDGYTWPGNAFDLQGFKSLPDPDGDKFPGITAVTKKDLNAPEKYTYPPIGIGGGGSQATADNLYIVSRISIAVDGKRTSCTTASGKATIKTFDNHVVGCRIGDPGTGSIVGIKKGDKCSDGTAGSAADFIDQNRTVYVPGDATFESKELTAGANCAAAINAFQGK